MKTVLMPNETLLREGSANLQRGLETTGGRLYLTTERLIFESGKFNVATGQTAITLSDILSVETGWTKLLGFIPLMPNALVISVKQDRRYRLSLWGRKRWREACLNAMKGATS
ncbi:GRAM domain-containing protein [Yersinia enterocolitica]